MANVPIRDHLFISYAGEDQAFARWLALRLTCEGYKVWFDQIKLLGGESYPRDIDAAIKHRTFRMLGLLSRYSTAKPNPLKERTLALNLSRERGEGFLIPLNVDGLSATELDWQSSDITFVPFSASWAAGLRQLLKLLEREKCPRGDADGRTIVSRIASEDDTITKASEQLTSNVCPFVQIPERVAAFRVSPLLREGTLKDAQRDWSCYSVSPHRVLAFHPPDPSLSSWLRAELAQEYAWRTLSNIEDIDTKNIVQRLLRGCVETRLCMRGFQWSHSAAAFRFTGRLGASISVVLPSGEETTVQPSGERTFFRVGRPKTPYRYWIAAKTAVVRSVFAEFSIVWRLRFHFTDADDRPLPETQRQSRRKHLTRAWFNRQWLVRHLATIQSCADSDGLTRIGPPGPEQVVVDCRPLSFNVDKGIDETQLVAPEIIGDDVPLPEGTLGEFDDADEASEPGGRS